MLTGIYGEDVEFMFWVWMMFGCEFIWIDLVWGVVEFVEVEL